MVDLLDLRMVFQEFDDLLRIFCVPLEAQRQRLRALQQQEGGKRGNGSALIAQQNGAHIGRKCCRTCRIDERNAVVAGVRVGNQAKFAAGAPVELAGVDDDAAERRAVTADELRCRVDHDVCAVRNGSDEIRGAEGIVDHDGKIVLVGNCGNRVDVGNVAVGISERFKVNCLRVRLDCRFDLGKVVRVDERCGHAECLERMGKQVVCAAVDGLLADDVIALLREGFDRIGDCRRTGGNRQTRDAAFKRGNALFKDVLRGVGESAIDVAGVAQRETVCRVLGIVEDVRSGGVNRNGAGIGGGVRLFLTDVKLQGFKMIVGHNNSPSLIRYLVGYGRFW